MCFVKALCIYSNDPLRWNPFLLAGCENTKKKHTANGHFMLSACKFIIISCYYSKSRYQNVERKLKSKVDTHSVNDIHSYQKPFCFSFENFFECFAAESQFENSGSVNLPSEIYSNTYKYAYVWNGVHWPTIDFICGNKTRTLLTNRSSY